MCYNLGEDNGYSGIKGRFTCCFLEHLKKKQPKKTTTLKSIVKGLPRTFGPNVLELEITSLQNDVCLSQFHQKNYLSSLISSNLSKFLISTHFMI